MLAAERRLADRYLLQDLLALGGMGAVWRGRDLRLDRPVAIKVMAGEALEDPTARERFEREARAVARLNHPNIVGVHDFGRDGPDSYLVMELVEGRTVAELLTEGPLPVAQAVTIAAQTCEGLAAAHTAGVVHRDVKPANLILTPGGVVKICDFGIARLQHAVGQSRLTGSAIAMGSTRYMAPEQVLDHPVDERADLYGLGCTLYAMLTGRPPFAGDNPITVVQQHVEQVPPDVRGQRPEVPVALAELVGALLAKEPASRPAGARAVAARLAGVGPDAPEPPRRRRPWALIGGGLAVVATLVAVPLFASTRNTPSTATVPPSVSLAPATSPAAAAPTVAPTPSPTVRRSPAVAVTPPVVVVAPTVAAPSAARTTPPPPVDPIAGLRLTIQQQVTTGHLAPDAAKDLYKKVDEIAATLDGGKAGESAKKVKEMRDKLAQLRRDGRLTPAGHDALTAGLDRVALTVPTAGPPPPPPKP